MSSTMEEQTGSAHKEGDPIMCIYMINQKKKKKQLNVQLIIMNNKMIF